MFTVYSYIHVISMHLTAHKELPVHHRQGTSQQQVHLSYYQGQEGKEGEQTPRSLEHKGLWPGQVLWSELLRTMWNWLFPFLRIYRTSSPLSKFRVKCLEFTAPYLELWLYLVLQLGPPLINGIKQQYRPQPLSCLWLFLYKQWRNVALLLGRVPMGWTFTD